MFYNAYYISSFQGIQGIDNYICIHDAPTENGYTFISSGKLLHLLSMCIEIAPALLKPKSFPIIFYAYVFFRKMKWNNLTSSFHGNLSSYETQ